MKEDCTRWWQLTIKTEHTTEKIYAQSIIPLLQLIYDRDNKDNISFKLKTVKK